MALTAKRFHIVDYFVFFGTVIISVSIGSFFACYKGGQSSNQQYLLGNRDLSVVPVSLSMLVTFVSAIGTMGYPAEIYLYGPKFMLFTIATAVGCTAGALLFIPLFYPLKLISINQYFEMRFRGKITKYAASIISLVTMELVNALNLFAPAVALEAVTGVPIWISMVFVGLATTFYTTLGGIRGVIYTDVFQAIVIFAGIIVVTVTGIIKIGGFHRVFELNRQWDRTSFVDFDLDPTKRITTWQIVFVNSLFWTSISANQHTLQRYCSLSSLKKAQIAQVLNIPGFASIGLMLCFSGMVAFAYYADQGCDPIRGGIIKNPNQILPYFALDILQVPGLPGLFIATLMCAAISSLSTCLNSMGAITWDDYLKPSLGHLSPKYQTRYTKISVMIYGLLAIALGFIVEMAGGTLIQLAYSILGSTYGPVVGLLFVAATLPLAGELGTTVGMFVGLTLTLLLATSSSFSGIHAPPLDSPTYNCNMTSANHWNISTTVVSDTTDSVKINADNYQKFLSGLDRLYAVSFLWYPLIGCAITYLFALILSIIPVEGFRMFHRVPSHLLFRFVKHFPCSNVDKTSYFPASVDEKSNGHQDIKLQPERDIKTKVTAI